MLLDNDWNVCKSSLMKVLLIEGIFLIDILDRREPNLQSRTAVLTGLKFLIRVGLFVMRKIINSIVRLQCAHDM